MGDGGKMEGQIGGAARGAADLDGIGEGRRGHDIPGPEVFSTSSMTLRPASSASLSRAGSVAQRAAVTRQGEAEGLRGNAHAVGRTHETAGPRARADAALYLPQFLFGNLPLSLHDKILSHRGAIEPLTFVMACRHIAAGDHDRGEVTAGGCHDKTGDDLVTGPDHHGSVVTRVLQHHLDGGRDEIPAGQHSHTRQSVFFAMSRSPELSLPFPKVPVLQIQLFPAGQINFPFASSCLKSATWKYRARRRHGVFFRSTGLRCRPAVSVE